MFQPLMKPRVHIHLVLNVPTGLINERKHIVSRVQQRAHVIMKILLLWDMVSSPQERDELF